MDNEELFEDLPPGLIVNPAADHIVVSIPMYERLRRAPAHPVPLLVWEHYWYTARIQGTKRVWATNTYLARGTGCGVAAVKAAKAWMVAEGLIQYVQGRARDGSVKRVYTELLGDSRVNSDPPVPQGQKRPSGETSENGLGIEVSPQGQLPRARLTARAVNDPGNASSGEETKGEGAPTPAATPPEPEEIFAETLASLDEVCRRARGRRFVRNPQDLRQLGRLIHTHGPDPVIRGLQDFLSRAPPTKKLHWFLVEFEDEWIPPARPGPVEHRCDKGHVYVGSTCMSCAREDLASPEEVAATLGSWAPPGAAQERAPA